MKNTKEHNYILYLLKKVNKRYNKSITLYYDPECKRENIIEQDNKFVLTYGDSLIKQARDLGCYWRYAIRYSLLHELGHIIHNLPYETFKEKIESEYSAERFALNYLKEYYPKTYRWASKEGYALIHNPKWATCNSEKHYRRAFERITEYCE